MSDLDIAIVGMSAVLPGAPDVATFWNNLVAGKCSLEELAEAELEEAGVDRADLRRSNYVRVGSRLQGIEYFDNEFFGISNREARLMDPQHRLLLEHGWKAFEDAGYDISRYPGRVGVYAGLGLNTYLTHALLGSPEVDLSRDGQAMILGNAADYAATRLSYLLDLRGPSMTIQTACSTALVAIHEGCQCLLSFQADMALAGGCSVTLPNPRGYLYQTDSLFSSDGRVRAFDARAAGTVFTSGLALVVLKRAADARRDGDYIHALIKGSAINNDGADKVGYVAPSIHGQSRVIQDALTISGIAADTIGYVETHGTATELGDLVEIRALTEAYRTATPATGFCAIGSVKTNVGHTDVAAGAVSLIKTALALKHRVLPASLGFESPNPRLELGSSPFFVNARTCAWETNGDIRRAAVSSFGIGGSNAHAVLEEVEPRAPRPWGREMYCLSLSARTAESLRALVGAYAAWSADAVGHDWADVCFTSNVGRRAFNHRLVILAENWAVAHDELQRATVPDGAGSARALSLSVDADGAAELVRALRTGDPERSGLVACPEMGEDPMLAAAQLVFLLCDSGIDARSAGSVADAAEEHARHGSTAEFQQFLRTEGTRFSGGDPRDCRLIVKQGSVWLDDGQGALASAGTLAKPAKLLTGIAGLAWRLGVALDWERFHAGEQRARVPLPTYTFARRRHWVAGRGAGRAAATASKKNPDIGHWFYRPVWQETAPAIRLESGLEGNAVLLIGRSPPNALMLEALAGARVVQVVSGDGFARTGPDQYRIALADERCYRELATALAGSGAMPRYLLHTLLVDGAPWSADGSGFAAAQSFGLNALVLLLRQLGTRLAEDQRLSVVVAASDLVDPAGGGDTNPDKATVIGATRTFPSEYPSMDCRIVDIPAADFEVDSAALQLLVAELRAPAAPENEIVAVRGGRRWQQRFARVAVPEACASPVSASGAYVILGGLGELGLNLSAYLAGRARCNLVLMGSSRFIERPQWDAWIAEHGEDHAYSRKIAALRAIESRGANVRIVQCDVGDRQRLHDCLDAATSDFGSLNAVIHAAGIVAGGMVSRKDVARFAEVFRAKVTGSYHLLEYLTANPGPRVILCSSMNALVGGLGQIDNTAANAFVDALATTHLARRAGAVCSINWGAINSARLDEPVVLPQFADLSREHKKNHMSEAEIHQVYDRILSWSFGPRVVVSTIDLDVVLRRWADVGRVTELARLRAVAKEIGPRLPVEARDDYRSPLHRFVVEAWCGILGIENLHWDDDLFAKGAHSLAAVQFSSMLKESLGVRLHSMGLYEFPRVGALVEYLQKLLDEQQAKAALSVSGSLRETK